jgi:hypothetical protein
MAGKLKPGPNFFGKLHHPAIGIRIPEIFLPGILAALKRRACAAGLMLSFGRETGPERVIAARPDKYPITLGHTGTSITLYQSAAAKAGTEAGIPVEVEADHLIVTGTPERAATRITGVHTIEKVSEEMLKSSIRYIYRELEEARILGHARCFTIDTSDLFNNEAMRIPGPRLEKEFTAVFPAPFQRRLINKYSGKKFSFNLSQGKAYSIQFNNESVMRLALRYKTSLEVSQVIYNRIRKDFGPVFGFEISLDETEDETRPADAFFYLAEWTGAGAHFDYFAPNIGFKKRADYRGSRSALRDRVNCMAAIASCFDRGLLSIHSGSGSTPYTGKGKGVYEALLSATGSKLKYKISGIYYELLLEILAGSPGGSDARRVFEDIFDAVADYCQKELRRKGPLGTRILKKQWREYKAQSPTLQSFGDGAVKRNPEMRYNPRSDFFRFHSYLALNLRGPQGSRPFREALVRLYQEDRALRKKVDQEVEALTERLIQGLRFGHNYQGASSWKKK